MGTRKNFFEIYRKFGHGPAILRQLGQSLEFCTTVVRGKRKGSFCNARHFCCIRVHVITVVISTTTRTHTHITTITLSRA